MIYLFNLNNYIGGGEVYVIQFAEYLSVNNIEFAVICSENSFIHEKALEKKLNHLVWPSVQLSINYATKLQKKFFISFFKKLDLKLHDIILTCNMRELYTGMFFLEKIKFQLRTIILHPEEYKYLASGSLIQNKYYKLNRKLLRILDFHELIIYPNVNARNNSIGCNDDYLNVFPFPISNSNEIFTFPRQANEKVKIITISRFVNFKISTILSLVKTVYKNCNYELVIIGYGPWKFLLKFYLFIYKTHRIIIISKVQPEDLKKYILKSNIGFAQGTSILQIIKFNIPVIIAPYSKWYSYLFDKVKSPGIFGFDNKITWGDIYWNLEKDNFHLDYLINEVSSNYNTYVENAKRIRQQLDEKIIFKNMVEYISIYREFIVPDDFIIPKPPIFKLILSRLKALFYEK